MYKPLWIFRNKFKTNIVFELGTDILKGNVMATEIENCFELIK